MCPSRNWLSTVNLLGDIFTYAIFESSSFFAGRIERVTMSLYDNPVRSYENDQAIIILFHLISLKGDTIKMACSIVFCGHAVPVVISGGQRVHTGSTKHGWPELTVWRECISIFKKLTIAHAIKNQFFIHESLIVGLSERFACSSRHEEIHIGLNRLVESECLTVIYVLQYYAQKPLRLIENEKQILSKSNKLWKCYEKLLCACIATTPHTHKSSGEIIVYSWN